MIQKLDWLEKGLHRHDIPDGPLYDPWRLKILPPSEFWSLSTSPTKMTSDQLTYLAWFGLLAPTTHNSIPQRIKFLTQERALEIWLDQKYILAASDPTGRQALISLGCVIQNVITAGHAYGLTHNLDYFFPTHTSTILFQKSRRYIKIAKITFIKGSSFLAGHWLRAMRERKVIRSEYAEKVQLPNSVKTQLFKLIQEDFTYVTCDLVEDKKTLHLVGKFDEQANKYKFEDKQFTRELGHWLTPNTNERFAVGMRGREFGLDDEFSQKIHLGLLGKISLPPDQMAFFARGNRVGIESASAVVVISVREEFTRELVEAGRAYEALALLLWQFHFCTSVHAGICEVEHIKRIFSATILKSERVPVLLFRTGQPRDISDWRRPHSSRPKVQEIILSQRRRE